MTRKQRDELADDKFRWDYTTVVLIVVVVAVILLATAELWLPHDMPHY